MKRLKTININTPEHYNDIFRGRHFKIHKGISQVEIRADHLLRKFNGGKFLDIGCGLAVNSLRALEMGAEVYAIDFSDKLIEHLSKEFPEINYSVQDARTLSYEDNYFDYIVMGEFLEHFDNPKEVISEAVRVLVSNGTLAVSVPLNDNGRYSEREHIWSFKEKDIRDLLSEFGEAETHIITGSKKYIIGYLKK